jgi:serine/threonine-protein kinase
VIHRDIKPENVLLGAGHAMVADFGIARAIAEAEASEVTAGTILGTPDYMSPEQISRDVELDGRTDIYSLGCLLFEALAGNPPFGGLTVRSVMLRRLVDPAPSLRGIDASIPPASMPRSPARWRPNRATVSPVRPNSVRHFSPR